MELLILCIAVYCYLWRPPLYTHNVEVLFFFVPYYFTAALPTSIALFWKRTKADPVRFRAFFQFIYLLVCGGGGGTV